MAILREELELDWPAWLFVQEAKKLWADTGDAPAGSLDWLMAEAFHEDVGAQFFEQELATNELGIADPWLYEARPERGLALVKSLVERSDEIRRYTPKRYYRARQKPLPAPRPLDMPATKRAFERLVAELAKTGYFDRAFGSSCLDSDDDPDVEGQLQLTEVLQEDGSFRPGFTQVWPMHKRRGSDSLAEGWSDGVFFDLIEALGDRVARPRTRTWHGFHREWDYSDFVRSSGQAVYRWRVNDLLDRSEVQLRLSEDGEDAGLLVTSTGDARDDLVERALRSPQPQVHERIAHAVALFRDRHATARTKHDATRTLADVLELRRALLKKELFTKDEGQLFQIQNEFALRHLNEQQKANYNPAFLDWVFWWFLGTIELTDRLLARQDETTG